MALVQGRNISLGYGNKKIVSDLSFTLNEGDLLCVVGENGSGKTTLMKSILGLLPVIDGSIELGDGLKRNQIGYLPQQTEIQNDFPASVWEIVLSGCLNQSGLRPYYNKREKEIAKNNMERLNIVDLYKKNFSTLSGGQQQRVLLARSLCATQKVLLLDEPVSGLDPKATSDMYEIIKELNEKHDISIIMISHDIVGAINYASHILHIDKTPQFFGEKNVYENTDIGKSFVAVGGE